MPEIQTENGTIYTPERRVVRGVDDLYDGEYFFDARYGASGSWWKSDRATRLLNHGLPLSPELMNYFTEIGKANVKE